MSLKALRRSRRRHIARHALGAAAAISLATAATYAVHLDASGAAPTGALGLVVTALELIFISAIIPLVLTSIYCVASLVWFGIGVVRERRTLPRASAR